MHPGQETPRAEGAAAHRHCMPLARNPFPRESERESWQEWRIGWLGMEAIEQGSRIIYDDPNPLFCPPQEVLLELTDEKRMASLPNINEFGLIDPDELDDIEDIPPWSPDQDND